MQDTSESVICEMKRGPLLEGFFFLSILYFGSRGVFPIHVQFTLSVENGARNQYHEILMILMLIHPGNQGAMMGW